MKRVTIVLVALTLTACATPPRWVSAMYNNQDACQVKNPPSYCGSGSSNRATIYTTPHQQPIGYSAGYIRTK